MAGRKGEKIWADAVRRAVMRRMEDVEGKPQKLERLADALVSSALEGETVALKEIGDRLDGKPAQHNINDNTHDLGDTFRQILEDIGKHGSMKPRDDSDASGR